MKQYLVFGVVIVMGLAFPSFAEAKKKAHLDDIKSTELEKESEDLRLEEEAASQQIATDEAKFVEKQAKEAREKLVETRVKRFEVAKKAKREIANSLQRVQTAEKKYKTDVQETTGLKKEISQKEKEMDKAIAQRNKAEEKAKAARMALEAALAERKKLTTDIKLAEKAKTESERETQRLAHQRTLLESELKLLREKAKRAQGEAKTKADVESKARTQVQLMQHKKSELQVKARGLAANR